MARFAADSSGPISVTLPDRTSATFAREAEGYSALADVAARCLPSVVGARSRAAEIRNVEALLTLEADANSRCRGNTGDTLRDCAERTEWIERLSALGMCYGRRNQAGAEMRWHKCGPDSNRMA